MLPRIGVLHGIFYRIACLLIILHPQQVLGSNRRIILRTADKAVEPKPSLRQQMFPQSVGSSRAQALVVAQNQIIAAQLFDCARVG